jgi:hypothetical protein
MPYLGVWCLCAFEIMLFVWSCVLCLLDMHSKHLLGSSMITLIDHNFPVRNKMFWHVVQFGNEIIVVEFFVWVDYKSFRFAYLQI